ncbi:dephospho-CoA kinase [Gemmatimonadota bacterium]
MMTIALTGSVASGKSAVAAFWTQAGVPVVDADELAREVVRPGSPGLAAVVEAFGPEILDELGKLRREALRKVVFRSREKRERLESILHPLIGALREGHFRERKAAGALLAVAEIPLLFETGLDEDFDVSVFVAAPQKKCLRRLSETRGIPAEEGLRIWEAQMDPEEKEARADFVIPNNGTLEDLREKALFLLDLLQAQARRAHRP